MSSKTSIPHPAAPVAWLDVWGKPHKRRTDAYSDFDHEPEPLYRAPTDDEIRAAWNATQDPIATVRTFMRRLVPNRDAQSDKVGAPSNAYRDKRPFFIRTVPSVMDHFGCSAEDAQRYIDLRDEGHSVDQAKLMSGLSDPPDPDWQATGDPLQDRPY